MSTPSIRNTDIFAWAQERNEEGLTSPTPIYERNGVLVMKGDYGHAIKQGVLSASVHSLRSGSDVIAAGDISEKLLVTRLSLIYPGIFSLVRENLALVIVPSLFSNPNTTL